jgi:hypothetical protein
MGEHDDTTGWKSSSRGEAAWKETKERVASRNAEARKEGMRQRAAEEHRREESRRSAAAKRHAQLVKRHLP